MNERTGCFATSFSNELEAGLTYFKAHKPAIFIYYCILYYYAVLNSLKITFYSKISSRIITRTEISVISVKNVKIFKISRVNPGIL